MKKARLLGFDTIGNTGFHIKEFDALRDFYAFLKCDFFEIFQVELGGKVFDVYADDSGALKPDPIPSMVTAHGDVMLLGNLIFANHDEKGETISLSNDDIQIILFRSAKFLDVKNSIIRDMIVTKKPIV